MRVNIINTKFLNLDHLGLKDLLDADRVFIRIEPLISMIHYQRKVLFSDDMLIDLIHKCSKLPKTNIKNGLKVLKNFKILIDSSNERAAVEI